MVVQRSHAEDTFPSQFIRADLKDDRGRLNHKNAAHDRQHDLLFADQRDNTQRRPEGEGAHITHKHLGRIGVKPQKAQSGGRQRATENGHLPGARYIGHL